MDLAATMTVIVVVIFTTLALVFLLLVALKMDERWSKETAIAPSTPNLSAPSTV